MIDFPASFASFHSKRVFGFFIRAANGQNSPQLRYGNTHVALTCPDEIGIHSPDFVGIDNVFRASLVQILTHYACELKI
jgi:hypothetical protein